MIRNSVLYNNITLIVSIQRSRKNSFSRRRKRKSRKQSRVRTCLEEFVEYVYVPRKEIPREMTTRVTSVKEYTCVIHLERTK